MFCALGCEIESRKQDKLESSGFSASKVIAAVAKPTLSPAPNMAEDRMAHIFRVKPNDFKVDTNKQGRISMPTTLIVLHYSDIIDVIR